MERTTVNRTEKEQLIAEMHQTFAGAHLVVVAHYSGMTVKEMGDLRSKMRQAGAGLKVTQNRLTRRALEGTKFKSLDGLFTGPTAIAYSKDPVAAAKVAVTFAKTNEKLKIIGGALDAEILAVDGVKALAMLPSLDELRGKIVGLIQAPATKIAGVLQAPAGQVARVFSAYASKSQAA
ncbi:MAG: 50S ribosomal protein L10 [Alphaproteobacteria bacterium]|nr:50S ribosomal protein L10 [Alphaproteobacteria bacterium]